MPMLVERASALMGARWLLERKTEVSAFLLQTAVLPFGGSRWQALFPAWPSRLAESSSLRAARTGRSGVWKHSQVKRYARPHSETPRQSIWKSAQTDGSLSRRMGLALRACLGRAADLN